MEANLVKKHSNNIIKSIAIGVTGLALTGGAYLLYKKIQKKLQKDRVLRTFTMIRKELFPVINRMKTMRETFLQQLGGGSFLPAELIADIMEMGNSEICFFLYYHLERSNGETVRKRAAAKNGMELSEFYHLAYTVYKDDK